MTPRLLHLSLSLSLSLNMTPKSLHPSSSLSPSLVSHLEFTQPSPPRPLTPSEISAVAGIVNSSLLGSSKSLAFHYVGLDEPDKPALYSYLSNPSRATLPPRRAFVIARADKQTHEVCVNIADRKVVSDRVYEGFGYPTLTFEEQIEASALPLNYPVHRVGEEERRANEGRGLHHVLRRVVRRGRAGEEGPKDSVLSDGGDGEPLHEASGGDNSGGRPRGHGDCGVRRQVRGAGAEGGRHGLQSVEAEATFRTADEAGDGGPAGGEGV
ncbi:primary amine oxidase 1-like [Iris pallida]|uniref:Amine oxidase n=1 Tax=Iris pallida TaxID=29817 RepID=A0AAX6DIC5_IRIPA|nr:primary amine oxidase 1-like [Iris pallida]